MREGQSSFTRRRQRLRWMLVGQWLLFFLIVGLVLLLALVSWRRALRQSQAAVVLPSALSFQHPEKRAASG
jgi:hypothetical protein